MNKLKRAVQMLAGNIPQRDICEQLHMGRGVLDKYKKAAVASGATFSELGRMSDEEIGSFLMSTKKVIPQSERRQILESLIPDYVSDLAHNHFLTILDLHNRYLQENPDGYGYTQFKQIIRDYQYKHNLSYHNTYVPGYEIQIDFAGDHLYLTDRNTGELTAVTVLVCCLPYSGIGYAKAMYNATMEFFLGGISDAFTYIGGTTRTAKSDNMKQWVKKYDRYEPTFNDAVVEWASYYGTSLETCRVRTPRDKGPIEGMVMKVYHAIYSKLRDEVFFDLDSLNSRIIELLDEFNSKPSRTTGRSRFDIFQAEEKALLGELPETPYRYRYRKEVKLTGNYHVEVTKHKYSVPYQYVGRNIVVMWDIDTVEMYCDNKRIALHKRIMNAGYTTVDAHMPANHLEYRRGHGYNAAFYLDEAKKIGPNTLITIGRILEHDKHVMHNYRSCMGVLALRKQYGQERLENACHRLSECGAPTYTMVKNVLLRNLDMISENKNESAIPYNDDVRGAESFVRLLEMQMS